MNPAQLSVPGGWPPGTVLKTQGVCRTSSEEIAHADQHLVPVESGRGIKADVGLTVGGVAIFELGVGLTCQIASKRDPHFASNNDPPVVPGCRF